MVADKKPVKRARKRCVQTGIGLDRLTERETIGILRSQNRTVQACVGGPARVYVRIAKVRFARVVGRGTR